MELERTEFVRVGTQHALLRRIVQAAEIDTVIDSRLVVDPLTVSPRDAHEINVIGTMNILAACGGPDSPVRKVVFKSSAHYYGCERDDPAFFTEAMQRPHPPRTRLESDVVEAENAVRGFSERNPDVTVSVLRFANGLGGELDTSHSRLLRLPAVPCILGFDPRYQFVHEEDIVGVLEHAVVNDMPGVFNVAGDGVLVLSRGGEPARQAAGADAAAVGDRAGRHGAQADGRADPRRDAPAAALRPRAGQPQAQGRRMSAPLHVRGRPSSASPRSCGSASCAAARPRRTATSARSRSSCATARACAAATAELQDFRAAGVRRLLLDASLRRCAPAPSPSPPS